MSGAGGEAPIRAAWGAASDVGPVRALNEDSFIAAFPVFVVADGMGGHEAGERASAEAVAALGQLAGQTDATARAVQDCLLTAQERVRAIETQPGRTAGTTVSGVVVAEQAGTPYWLVVNVGDSRTYRLAGGTLHQISVDHSEVQELLDSGSISRAEAAVHPLRSVVTRALGAGVELDPDFWLLPIEENDRVLVCTDGLTGELSDGRIAAILLTEHDPQGAADLLVRAAIEAGGRDNITVLVVDAHDVGSMSGDELTAPRGVPDDDTVPRPRTDEGVSSR